MDPRVDDELISILKNSSLSMKTRAEGWNYVLGLSATGDGLNHIINSGKYIPFLLSYISRDDEKELTTLAYKSLINIAAEEHGTFAIIKTRKDICSYLLHSICQENSTIKYMCYLLANMSAYSEIVNQIIHILLSSKGLLQNLIAVYSSSDSSVQSQYDFLTLVFANVSRVTEGRRLFLQDPDFLINILKFIKSSEPESRRIGTALILRNCCLETDYHEKLLNNICILPALLLPLMVPQQYEEGGEMGALPPELQLQCLNEVKKRDESVSVRRVLIEALTILCYTETGWRYLKSNGTYYVVRDLHAVETDATTKDAVEQLVAYFLVEDYQAPKLTDTLDCEDVLVKQLAADFTEELPDIVINEASRC